MTKRIAEEQPLLLPRGHSTRRKRLTLPVSPALRPFLAPILALALILIGAIVYTHSLLTLPDSGLSFIDKCAWKPLQHHTYLLSVPRIGQLEYLLRQQTLASALKAADVDAFIAEPSASSAYYANISAEFKRSERPFLMILDNQANFSYLVPQFEAGRIAELDMVYKEKTVIQWPETASPYQVLAQETGFKRVMVDEHLRYMIAAGLAEAGIEVVPMSLDVQQIREVKTEAEIAILRGINSFTLELVTALRPCLRRGMTQEFVRSAAQHLFQRAGVGNGFWILVLFGDQAAYPHGGKTGKKLEPGEFVLIDIGSSLHGYGSDVTRTILPDFSQVSDELMDIWHLVQSSQTAAFDRMHANETCSEVDGASRQVIAKAGYEEYYTHRLGHGLGLETHEHPYLNGANKEKLKLGVVSSNEPVSLPPVV
jgi:Xaa-Pro aminopeptidase